MGSSRTDSNSSSSDTESHPSEIFSYVSSTTTARTCASLRPITNRGETWPQREQRGRKVSFDDEERSSTKSVGTLGSANSSVDDLQPGAHDYPPPDDELERYWSDALPATSQEFADLYPSTRRLDIRHDDSTSDGNMNLRVDTKITLSNGQQQKLTLFHLRMHDLRTRTFSLRRYARDSGREVCHSYRKRQDQLARPAITRSLSSVLSKSFKSKAELNPRPDPLKRHDSGHSSLHVDVDVDDDAGRRSPKKPTSLAELSDVISMEFTNYFHLDLRRNGRRTKRHYDFNYWGITYTWKRVFRNDFGISTVTYHLLRNSDGHVLAHVVPVQMTDDEAREEEQAGGWVPPYSLWLSKGQVSTDLGDLVMATGLLAFVDDSIRRRFHSKENRRSVTSNIANLRPIRWIDDVWGRQARPHTAH